MRMRVRWNVSHKIFVIKVIKMPFTGLCNFELNWVVKYCVLAKVQIESTSFSYSL